MLTQIIAHARQSLQDCFDPQAVEQAARASGFVQRQSKLSGFVFLKALVLGFLQYPQATLNQLCGVCADLQVQISPQGLDERLNEAGVAFLQERLADALAHLRTRSQAMARLWTSFTDVYLLDSTSLALPEGLRSLFSGSGGNASPAALKIQLLFGLRRGQLAQLEVQSGTCPDSAYAGHLPFLPAGSLLIQDLGFFNLGVLQAVAERGACFLTRWRQDVQLFLDRDPQQPLEMLSFLDRQTQPVASYPVQVGQRAHLPSRLIVVCLPQEVAEQRRRRVKADAQRRGTPARPRSLALCDWNLFLTNVPEEHLSLRQILASYGLRWQVELIFKLWKSQAALDRLAQFRPARALGELYAKMIAIVLTHFLVAPLRFLLLEQRVEISAAKARTVLQDRAKELNRVLGGDARALHAQLEELLQRMLRLARKNKRKKHLSSLDRWFAANDLSIAQLYPLA